MVKLKVVENAGSRVVMDKLGAFVEEGRIVLIGFHDKAVTLT